MISILLYFRYSQKKLDSEIDELNKTPADYTVIVKNIPRSINTDYKKKIRELFEEQQENIIVSKVVLVYDMHEIEEHEKEVEHKINQKKQQLLANNFNHNDPSIIRLNYEIHSLEKKQE